MSGFPSPPRRREHFDSIGFDKPKGSNEMIIEPTEDRILVELDAVEEKTAGGIILPDVAKEKPQQGVVVAIGPGKVTDYGFKRESALKVGDKVLLQRYAGHFVKDAGKDLTIVEEGKILAVIKDED